MLYAKSFMVFFWLIPVALNVMLPLCMLVLFIGGRMIAKAAGKENDACRSQSMFLNTAEKHNV